MIDARLRDGIDNAIVDLDVQREIRDIAERGTDLDNAAFFARRAKGRLLYNFTAKTWVDYDCRRWRVDKTGAVMQLAKEVVREMLQLACSITDDSLRARAVKNSLAAQQRKRLEAMIALAQSDLPASPEAFDADPYAFNVLNGTLDLRTCELRPHRPGDLITKLAAVTYDANATCPRWEQFVSEVLQGDAELVDFMQRFVGLCLTGAIIEHFFAVLYGSGSNGKSTLLNILSLLLGDYGAVIDPALLTTQHNPQGASPELVRLSGVRLVAASEMPEGGRFAESRLKRLTGGDRVPARDLFQGVIEMQPSWKIVVATNSRPIVRDSSEGFWRRVRLVPFEAAFTGTHRDERLREKLVEELPGILNWALIGCQRWQEHGLGEPRRITAATSTYRADSDLIGSFIGERCVKAENARVNAAALYRAFVDWAKDAGERTIPPATTFRTSLRERGIVEGKSHKIRELHGIGLRDFDCETSGGEGREGRHSSLSLSRERAKETLGGTAPPTPPSDGFALCPACHRLGDLGSDGCCADCAEVV